MSLKLSAKALKDFRLAAEKECGFDVCKDLTDEEVNHFGNIFLLPNILMLKRQGILFKEWDYGIEE